MGSLNGLSKNSSPNKLSKLSSHCLEEVRWESTGSPLGVHWESIGSPLAVPWESAGSPLGVHWGSAGSSANGLSKRALQMTSFISGVITTLDCNIYHFSDCNIPNPLIIIFTIILLSSTVIMNYSTTNGSALPMTVLGNWDTMNDCNLIVNWS